MIVLVMVTFTTALLRVGGMAVLDAAIIVGLNNLGGIVGGVAIGYLI